jgi:hypothetical protein
MNFGRNAQTLRSLAVPAMVPRPKRPLRRLIARMGAIEVRIVGCIEQARLRRGGRCQIGQDHVSFLPLKLTPLRQLVAALSPPLN